MKTDALKTRDGLSLQLHDFGGAPKKALVMLLHGYGEHAGRYSHVASALREQGIAMIGADLRGHGRSAGPRGAVSRFDDYHQDADTLLAHVETKRNGAPVFLFGHSMGGLLALHWLLARGTAPFSGAILSSPFLGVALAVPTWKSVMAKGMSRFLPAVSLPSGLTGKDVTRDPDMAALYDSDPLNVKVANARWYTEALSAIESVKSRAAELELPTLLLYGGHDKIASADATDDVARRLRMEDKTAERLPAYYHELVNEPPADRAVILKRIADWILARA